MSNLIDLFIKTGLLQFGWFEPGGTPFRLNLDMLPAYPDVLKELVLIAKPQAADMSRLVCTADALPFGVGLSQETNIPLVYSRGSAEAPTHDLVGAYDIGHPALLLVNTLDNIQNTHKLVMNARNVGLQIHHALAIFNLIPILTPTDITVQSLLNLRDVVHMLVNDERLPTGQGKAVLEWLDRKYPG